MENKHNATWFVGQTLADAPSAKISHYQVHNVRLLGALLRDRNWLDAGAETMITPIPGYSKIIISQVTGTGLHSVLYDLDAIAPHNGQYGDIPSSGDVCTVLRALLG